MRVESAGLSKRKLASQPAHFRRRDFERREVTPPTGASAPVATPRSSISTHTHTLHTTAPVFQLTHDFPFTSPSRPSAPPALPLLSLLDSFAHRQSHAPGPHRRPCAVRAISAASGHSNKQHGLPACVSVSLASAPLVSAERVSERALPACLPPSACSLLRSCCSSCCRRPSPLQAPVDSWSTRFSQPPACPSQPASTALHRPPAVCVTACPVWLCWIAPPAPENPLPPPHSDRLSRTSSQSVAPRLLRGSIDRPGSDSSAPRKSQLAQALISPTCRRRSPSPPVISSTSPHLRQSRLHHLRRRQQQHGSL